jgi:hypothetical protein
MAKIVQIILWMWVIWIKKKNAYFHKKHQISWTFLMKPESICTFQKEYPILILTIFYSL